MCVAYAQCRYPTGAIKGLGSKILEAQEMSKFIPDADSTWRTW